MQQLINHYGISFLSLLDRLNEGVVIHRCDTTILYANKAASEILGLPLDQIIGKNAADPVWNFTDEKLEPLSIDDYPIQKLLHSHQNLVDQLVGIRSSDGSLKWADINGSLIAEEGEDPIALLFFSDVTDRKNAYDEAALFKHLVDVVDTGITITDPSLPDNPLIYVNRAFTETTGYSAEDALGRNCRFLREREPKQPALGVVYEALKNAKSCEVELRNFTKEGKLFHNLLNITPMFDTNNKLKYFIGVQHDISHQKQNEEKLAKQALYIQSILDAQENIVYVTENSSIIYANQPFFDFFAVASLEDFLQHDSCICGRFLQTDLTFTPSSIEGKMWIHEILALEKSKRIVAMKSPSNEKRFFSLAVKELVSDRYIITLNDISQSLLRELFLKNKAYHDPLTGALNRQYFYDYYDENRQNITSLGIIMVDLDYFKKINDTYGHGIGDDVLKQVAESIQNSIRNDDTLIRWGGEEFILLINTAKKSQLISISEHIRRSVSEIVFESIPSITASLGATLLLEGESFKTVIERADQALYSAKANGRNRIEVVNGSEDSISADIDTTS
ncbi:MAG: diguanylate cyclase [Sulfuricurvum sp.]|uniref:diguanylate cyclase n=1 Tax=Sulfuricurvum sp. TaxID=2025608 RepID=UPI0027223619|nr:diguanylate cyclase [Sulfuricurvum sp.]MDO9055350.1 diguanylate cyclase [Sulfuricurvum sp.]